MKLIRVAVLKFSFIFCCLVTLVILLNSIYHSAEPDIHSGIQYSSESYDVTATTKVLLLWNSYFSSPNWYLKQNTTTFHINDNENCIITNEHNFLPSVDKFNAILFHTARDFPDVPKVRNVRQAYVFVVQEAPVHTTHKLSDKNNFFNITMTYRLDADVIWPYNYVRDAETNALIAPAVRPHWKEPDLNKFVPSVELMQLINGKNKSIAWFVSLCRTDSKRERLVKQLKKHINVDIYGKCGPLSCPRGINECDEVLDKQYKFYLSFENSLCVDYVTEKFFNTLRRSIVPIVYGGADYNRFAPPHSYIDVQDFENTKELAKYLKYLEQNTTAYGEYFWWKSYYTINNYDYANKIPRHFQELCRYLHKMNNKKQYYENIAEYWVGGACKKPNTVLSFDNK